MESETDVLKKALSELNHFDLTGKISVDESTIMATGGYFEIYCGMSTVHGCKVAVRRLRLLLRKEPVFTKRLARELKIWSKLIHPNILPLLGFAIGPEGFPAFISEWMDSGTAREYLVTFPDADIESLALDITCGLRYLHSMNIVHGDMKLDNVLMSSDRRAQVTDFGISHLVSSTTSAASTTGGVKGTDRWMAPELFLPKSDDDLITKEADVWALGMTIYELMTTKLPYHECRTSGEVVLAIMQNRLPSPPGSLATRSDVEHRLWSACESCWKADPKKRSRVAEVQAIIEFQVDIRQLSEEPYRQIAISKEGKSFVLTVLEGHSYLYKVDSEHEQTFYLLREPPIPVAICDGAAFSQDGSRVTLLCDIQESNDDGYIFSVAEALYVFDAESMKHISTVPLPESKSVLFPGHGSEVFLAPRSPPENSGNEDELNSVDVRVINTSTGRTRKLSPFYLSGIRSKSPPIVGITASSDGSLAAACGASVKLWHMETGRPLAHWKADVDFTHAVAFTSGGEQLVTGGTDATVKLWDLPQRLKRAMNNQNTTDDLFGSFASLEESKLAPVATFSGNTASIRSIFPSSDGRYVWSHSCDDDERSGAVRVWDIRKPQDECIWLRSNVTEVRFAERNFLARVNRDLCWCRYIYDWD